MSIKLQFEKGSLSTRVTLKDEALPALLEIISAHQSDEAGPPQSVAAEFAPSLPDLNDPAKEPQRLEFARSWLKQHSASEALSKIGWQNYPENILILGALIESKGDDIMSWRSADIETQFQGAREQPPGNFGRDISNAIRNGVVATVTPRTYRVTRTGWLKIYEGIIAAETKKLAN